MQAALATAIAVVLAALLATWWRNDRYLPWTRYEATPGWIRAGIYFCFCWLIAWASGAWDAIANHPIATPEQLSSARWWAFTALAFGFVCIAYGVVWVYYTVRFDRPRRALPATVFGVLWGASSGQLFLAVWLLMSSTTLPTWGAWLASWIVLGAWQPNFHNIYWDRYIAPEHDTRLTQRIKALGCHIPNLAITLTYLAVHGNAALFVSFQVIACTAAATGMRFQPPGYIGGPHDLAARSTGRPPRCTGYQSDDFTTDPYTPFHPGWHAPQPQPT